MSVNSYSSPLIRSYTPDNPFANLFEQRSFQKLIAIVGGIGSAAFIAFTVYKRSLNRNQPPEDVPVPDKEEVETEEILLAPKPKKLILYQVQRGFFTPAVAPFALKLETFLRVAKIDYDVNLVTSQEGVISPWLKFGDEEIRNTNECFGFLCKTFNVDLSAGVSSSRKTAARLVDVLFDSRIFWGVALWRWVFDEGRSMKEIQPLSPTSAAVLQNVKVSVLRAAHYHGFGWLPEEEVVSSVVKDLENVSAALGKHDYFYGRAPGQEDCNAFSLLAQMVWNLPGSPFERAIKRHKVLMEYVMRMKENYWPDWDDLTRGVSSNYEIESLSSDNVFADQPAVPQSETVGQNSEEITIPLYQAPTNGRVLSTPSNNSSLNKLNAEQSQTVRNVLSTHVTPGGATNRSRPSSAKSVVNNKPTNSLVGGQWISNSSLRSVDQGPITGQESMRMSTLSQTPMPARYRPDTRNENLANETDSTRFQSDLDNSAPVAQYSHQPVQHQQFLQDERNQVKQHLRNEVAFEDVQQRDSRPDYQKPSATPRRHLPSIEPQVHSKQTSHFPQAQSSGFPVQLQASRQESQYPPTDGVNSNTDNYPLERPSTKAGTSRSFDGKQSEQESYLADIQRATEAVMRPPSRKSQSQREQDQLFLQSTGAYPSDMYGTVTPQQYKNASGRQNKYPRSQQGRAYGGTWK